MRADGKWIDFDKVGHRYMSRQPGQGVITDQPLQVGDDRAFINARYEWTDGSGKKWRFAHYMTDPMKMAALMEIVAPTGERLELQRDFDGQLLAVTDPQGRQMVLIWVDRKLRGTYKGVQYINTPVGRYTYSYGRAPLPADQLPSTKEIALKRAQLANLASVRIPTSHEEVPAYEGANRDRSSSEVTRFYHYEYDDNPSMLTGISISGKGSDGQVMNQRLSSWAYDQSGRAVLSVKGTYVPGKAGTEQVTFVYGTDQTVLTNSVGGQTTYRYKLVAGQRRLVEVRGVGCTSCGEVNIRYGYDSKGRTTSLERLNDEGKAISLRQWRYDEQGRPTAQYDQNHLSWRRSYEGDNAQPSAIIWPSVIAGKEHRLDITWNNFGQPLTVRESGYEPLRQEPISRSVSFTYTTMKDRSLLARIEREGSAATQLQWDGNFVTRRVESDGTKWHLVRDKAGRVVLEEGEDGQRRWQVKTAYAQQGTIALQEAQRQEWAADGSQRRALQWQYNALGLPSVAVDMAGRAIHLGYGSSESLVSVADGQGNALKMERDSEGRMLMQGLYRAGTTKPEQASYQWWDVQGRMAGQLSPDGSMQSWRYDDAGRVQEVSDDGEEVHTSYRYNGALQVKQGMKGWVGVTANFSTSKVDDFGRTVQTSLPVYGTTRTIYDSSDRPLQQIAADGSSTRYEWDGAGRLLSRSYYNKEGTATATVRMKYEGTLLAGVDDGQQQVSYTYDGIGRRIGEVIHFAGLKQSYVLQTTYDRDSGLIQRRTLADGRIMRLERAGAGATVERVILQSKWVAAVHDYTEAHLWEKVAKFVKWLLPGEVVLRKMQVDVFNGLSDYETGNGIATHKEFDVAGRLVRLESKGVFMENYDYGIGRRIRQMERKDPELITASYDYEGLGQLALRPAALMQTAEQRPAAPVRVAASVAEYDERGRVTSDGKWRYQYNEGGQVAVVLNYEGQTIAQYSYNGLHQRVKKEAAGKITRYLWQDGHLVAEINEQGEVSTQYLYLDTGVPVAKLSSSETWYIHSDHRGMPLAMSDRSQQIVWRAKSDAYGLTQVALAPASQASLNLRLPGQYYDEETGLHDNWYRSYNPATGKYLQPDPVVTDAWRDPYRYAQGDPINQADPMGLYEIDVHYYMTYFLALMAGIDPDRAKRIALADQYIDDNPYTSPTAPSALTRGSLGKYHFVLDESDQSTDITKPPSSKQLNNLKAAYTKKGSTCTAQDQFFGEFLHAYADTFAHRDKNNEPFNSVIGHALYGHGPDFTYTDPNNSGWDTNVRPDRTLEMEKEVYGLLRKYGGNSGTAVPWENIKDMLEIFNQIREGEEKGGDKTKAMGSIFQGTDNQGKGIEVKLSDSSLNSKSEKLQKLNDFLQAKGMQPIPYYDVSAACRNRGTALQGLKEKDYEGTILKTPPDKWLEQITSDRPMITWEEQCALKGTRR